MNRKLLAGLSIFVIVGTLFWLYRSHRPRAGELKGESYDQLAQLAGDETGKLLGNHGSVVVVKWDATAMGIPRYDRQIAQFRARAGTHGVKVSAVEVIKLKRGVNAPAQRFAEIVRRSASADAIVLFGGAYGLRVRDLAALPSPHPQLISVAAFDTILKPLFERQLLALAIVERGYAGEATAEAGPFVAVHPADVATLPPCPPGLAGE